MCVLYVINDKPEVNEEGTYGHFYIKKYRPALSDYLLFPSECLWIVPGTVDIDD